MVAKKQYKCSNCQAVVGKWTGQCMSCKEWSTIEEFAGTTGTSRGIGVKTSGQSTKPAVSAMRVRDIKTSDHLHMPTGIGEFDRVLGGGLIPGGVILLAGEPGAGKSTILATVAGKAAETGKKTLFISGEESVQQIALRSERIGALSDNMYIASESDLSKILGHIDEVQPSFVVIDSIQTIGSPDLEGRMGEKSQITEVSTILTRVAKEKNIPMVLVGHVTKDGNIAGPRTIEHLVDVVIFFEGDKDSPLRLLRGIKNRYGAADEVGCFEHTESGIIEVPDPSGLLLGRRDTDVAGVVTAVSIEGRRPLPLEIQALVAGSFLPVPRKAVSGLDSSRISMINAVVERHGKITLADKDVYVSTIGGLRTREPSVDLATALAIASAAKDFIIPSKTVVIGEVMLSGEIRAVPGVPRRIAEAQRLGFTHAIIPDGTEPGKLPKQFSVTAVKTIKEAINLFS